MRNTELSWDFYVVWGGSIGSNRTSAAGSPAASVPRSTCQVAVAHPLCQLRPRGATASQVPVLWDGDKFHGTLADYNWLFVDSHVEDKFVKPAGS